MAFIFQAEKKTAVGPINTSSPGPGYYAGHEDIKGRTGYAPFLSTVERGIVKKEKSTTPGPGSYDTVLTIENSLKYNQAFHSTLAPTEELFDSNNLTTAFKSRTKRFEYKIDTEQPGPGKYYKDLAIGKSKSVSNLHHPRASIESPVRQLLREERVVIPSIPSYKHSYGYSEADRNKLSLNKNPLLEIQEFVGPGYYDIKNTMSQDSNKGTTWHRSGTKRFESKAAKLPTKNLGPGSYDATNLEGVMPKYKAKASSGFASTTGRMFADKTKNSLTPSKSTGQFAIGFDAGKLSEIFEGNKEVNFYTEESLPGPGHYHNEAVVSSLKLNYKPTHLQFFGSGTERFRNESVASEPLGPGEYNVLGSAAPKKLGASSTKSAVEKEAANVPFQSTGVRFGSLHTLSLGPGVYDPKANIVDRVNDKARRGYLGSFGSTEIRLKPKKIPEETADQARQREMDLYKVPEITDEQKKSSHVFASKTHKVTANYKPHENPPPGAYEPTNYDIARRVTENESYFYTAKKVPFNASQPRFNYKEPEAEPVSDERFNLKKNVIIKANPKNNQGSVFTSQTKRATTSLPKNGMPGPGAYQTTAGWLKKSYNIKFLDN